MSSDITKKEKKIMTDAAFEFLTMCDFLTIFVTFGLNRILRKMTILNSKIFQKCYK